MDESDEKAVQEFVERGVAAAERVDLALFGQQPQSQQRANFRRYVRRLVAVVIGATIVWYALDVGIGLQSVSRIGWGFLCLAAIKGCFDVWRNRRKWFIPNGRLIGDDDVAFADAIAGAIVGVCGSDIIGVPVDNAAILGCFIGGVYGLLDAVSARYPRPMRSNVLPKQSWKQWFQEAAVQFVPVPLLAGLTGAIGEILTPDRGWVWALVALVALTRLQLSASAIVQHGRADFADCVGAFLWGTILGITYGTFSIFRHGPGETFLDHTLGRLAYAVFLGWMAMIYAVESGIPLGTGPAGSRILRAVGLAVVASFFASLIAWCASRLLIGDSALLAITLSPYVSFVIWVHIARYWLGPLENGSLAGFVTGLANQSQQIVLAFKKPKLAGGFLR
jgi:hypothetical protein